VVLAGALVTYGGVSLFVAFFVLAADGAGAVSGRRHSAKADAGGDCARTSTFHDDGVPGTPPSERDSNAFFRHHAFAAPGLGIIPRLSCWDFGLRWLAVPKPPPGGQARVMVVC